VLLEGNINVGVRLPQIANFLADGDGNVRVLYLETAGIIGDRPSPIRIFHIKPEFSDVCTADLANFLTSVLCRYSEQDPASPPDPSFDLRAWVNRDPETKTAAWACNRLRERVIS
jgi:hypothetical protein